MVSVSPAQENKRYVRNPEKDLFGKSLNKKKVKIKESRSIVRAKKKQATMQKKQEAEYADYVKKNRSRALEIQSPEVRSRMKQNRKDADIYYKNRKKKVEKNTRTAERKYKK
jgi:transcriptional regulator of nitric oxide reductase